MCGCLCRCSCSHWGRPAAQCLRLLTGPWPGCSAGRQAQLRSHACCCRCRCWRTTLPARASARGLQPSAVSAAVPAAARCAATPPGCMAAASVDCAAAQQRGRCGSDHSSKCSHGSRRPGGSALRIRCSASWGSALWSGSVPRTFQHPQRAASCAVAACTSSGHQAALCLALMRGPCRNTAARRCTAGSGANLNPAAPHPHPEFEVKD